MIHQIKITEEDIYKFVFSPKTLEKDKFDYLTENRDRFKNEIALCTDLKESALEKDADSLTNSIIERISSHKRTLLLPQLSKSNEENGVKLAAASVTMTKRPDSMSFIDEEAKYVIRIVKTETDRLLYLFTNDNSVKGYKIQLYPSEAVYQMADVSQPIEISEEDTISEILIEDLNK